MCSSSPRSRSRSLRVFAQREEVEAVRVLQDLLRQVGLRGRQGALEVGGGAALALEEAALDLEDEHVAAPAVFDCLADVPLALLRGGDFVQEGDVVVPGQFVQAALAQMPRPARPRRRRACT